ncbi:hypothetical protein [Pseudomonas putida]|uniref:Uncharacterized protein n=1 Tax=Pseudomonas putida TaxID=303 RepID=A0A8I1EII8_PSEPU|nr:hypothetical protein [Pseudomonas putida]MBI6885813.1 hypothetical protein [Pseudomonas putida]
MTTFQDILTDFELGAVAPLPEFVLEKLVQPDLHDEVLGHCRWCKCCGELWPLDDDFYYQVLHKPSGWETTCRACIHESVKPRLKKASRSMRTPVNTPGQLTVYFPEAPAQTCSVCRRVYPKLGLFWQQESTGELTTVCASCTPAVSIDKAGSIRAA